MRSFHIQSLLSSVFLLSCFPSQAQHSYGLENPRVRHRHINSLSSTFDAKYKRDANVAFTYFIDGLGACGATNGPGDFIVALNSAEYDGGAHCFEMITIVVNGKTAQAQIMDECPTCSPGGLDFSQGLFQYFASLSEGEIYGSWSYKTTSSSTLPPPTTLYTATSTTTMAATTTSSSTTSSTTTTTSLASSVVPTSTPTSTSTTSTVPTSTPQDPQVIAQINLALLELGSLLDASLKL